MSYVAAIVADVPVAWGVQEFVMFLDSAEKRRRLFGNTRKNILICEWDFHEGLGGATDSKRVAIGASWFDRSRGRSVEATPSCRSGRRWFIGRASGNKSFLRFDLRMDSRKERY